MGIVSTSIVKRFKLSQKYSKMTRHSKNAESLGHFTHNEKKKLKNVYGTLTQRLGQESMRKFNACVLCLQTARQPQLCPDGHLYCRV